MNDVEPLTEQELLALAALLRLLIRMDGRFTDAEREALSVVARSVQETGAPVPPQDQTYRSAPDSTIETIGEDRLDELLERAAKVYPNDEAVREAVLRITRQEARETIYGLVFEVSTADATLGQEPELLDWLAREWNLSVTSTMPE
jgi:hypothetical protein